MRERTLISPLARKIALERNIDISAVNGTGPNGRIIKRDLEAINSPKTSQQRTHLGEKLSQPALGAPPSSTLPDARLYADPSRYDELTLTPMQTSIAARLVAAKQAMPHFYLSRDLDVDEIIKLRQKVNAILAEKNEKVSINDFLIRAVALALMEEPSINVSFTDNAILRHHHADIGVAVALPEGLITPIIRDAETKSVQQISQEVKALAARAQERRLKPSEYEGGSFTISNLGMYDIDNFTAVINPPQAAILAIGRIQERLQKTAAGDITSKNLIGVTLSCDHRAINGAVGARWLSVLAYYVAAPHLLMFT